MSVLTGWIDVRRRSFTLAHRVTSVMWISCHPVQGAGKVSLKIWEACGQALWRDRALTFITHIALAWSAISSLLIYPHSLSYFNEMVGGPEKGHDYLVDSNIDWGQDLLFLKAWLDEHPQARPLHLAYLGYSDPRVLGIAFTLPPMLSLVSSSPPSSLKLEPGWYVISVSMLHGYRHTIPDGEGRMICPDQDAFAYFQRLRPVARAGYSIYIYHVTPTECDCMRLARVLGLALRARNCCIPES